MKLVAAVCPSCGAKIKVDRDCESTECEYCGSEILVDDAIKVKIEHSGKVEVDGIENVNSHLIRAKKYLKLKQYFEAMDETNYAIELDELVPEIYELKVLINLSILEGTNVQESVDRGIGLIFHIGGDLKRDYDKYLKLIDIEDNKENTLKDREEEIEKYIKLYIDNKPIYDKVDFFNKNKVDRLLYTGTSAEERTKIIYNIFKINIESIELENTILTNNLLLISKNNNSNILVDLSPYYKDFDDFVDKFENELKCSNIRTEKIMRVQEEPILDHLLAVAAGLVVFIPLCFIAFNICKSIIVFDKQPGLMRDELMAMVYAGLISWIAAFITAFFYKSKTRSNYALIAFVLFGFAYLGSYLGVIFTDLSSGQVKGLQIVAFIISLVVSLFTSILPAIITFIAGGIVMVITIGVVELAKALIKKFKINKINK